jgi:xanthine dehydrogenase accessory factor
MLFRDYLVLIRGGGDLATGVTYRLHKAGFPVMVFELPRPLVVRRKVALATAVIEKEITVEGMRGVLVESLEEGVYLARQGDIPVLIKPKMTLGGEKRIHKFAATLVDARMAKRNIDTHRDQAPFVIALGPGFTAGEDCHVVIETKRGHHLGRVLWEGKASPDSGTPGLVEGKGSERVIRSPADGTVSWNYDIGQRVREGTIIGSVGNKVMEAPFDGLIRGLISPGSPVRTGLKIGDIDPGNDVAACFTISDKALSVGGGVLEAILSWINRQQVSVV